MVQATVFIIYWIAEKLTWLNNIYGWTDVKEIEGEIYERLLNSYE